MGKLNQIIAIEKGVKSRAYADFSELHKVAQKGELFNGFSRTYRKIKDDDEDLPAEGKRVQFVVKEVLRSAERSLTDLMDVTARKDWTNCKATADVLVDGKPIISGAPVSFLLLLEKQLTDLRTFVAALPVLDESEKWDLDPNSGLFVTDKTSTHRTKKIPKPVVLYPATPDHPAQTQMVTEDVVAGFWDQVKQSGAMQKPARQDLLERVDTLLRAIKIAREQANMSEEVETPRIGKAVFEYLMPT